MIKDGMIIDNFTIALQEAQKAKIDKPEKEKEKKSNGKDHKRTDNK